MGPASRAAVIRHQVAMEALMGSLLEELQGIRSTINTFTGRYGLDKETLDERLLQIEERIYKIERPARPSG